MPYLETSGCRLYYEDAGEGEACILFAHGLLWNCREFDRQVSALKSEFRCISLDFRGHGLTECEDDDYSVETLTRDVIRLLESLKPGPVIFVGVSTGAFTGLRIAARRPDLIHSMVLMGVSADREPPDNFALYRRLNFTARWISMRLIADRAMYLMFGRRFLNDRYRRTERETWRRRLIENRRFALTGAVRGVIHRESIFEELPKIKAPTLILSGEDDKVCHPDRSRQVLTRIPNAEMRLIPRAGHTMPVEEPDEINAWLLAFAREHRPPKTGTATGPADASGDIASADPASAAADAAEQSESADRTKPARRKTQSRGKTSGAANAGRSKTAAQKKKSKAASARKPTGAASKKKPASRSKK